MTWLDPITGLIALGSILPPLLALYVLKLRRRTRNVSSTLLWRTATADLRANVPFQRLRFSLLLLLQLIVLVLLALALAQPESESGVRAGRHALLIDRSLSMQARDLANGHSTRLDVARDAAVERIEALHAGGFWLGESASIMVVAFGGQPAVMSGFTDGTDQATRAVRSIEPVDGATPLAEAIELVRGALATANPDDPNAAEPEEVVYEIFSDGRVDDLAQLALRPHERIVFHSLGSTESSNRSVASIGTVRDPGDPALVKALARLVYWGSQPTEAELELVVGGSTRSVLPTPVALPSAAEADGLLRPGEVEVSFPAIALPDGGVVEVRFTVPDELPADDGAVLVIPPPRDLRLAMLGADEFIVRSVLESLNPATLEEMSAEEFSRRASEDPAFSRVFDAVVVRGAIPVPLPPGRYLLFGDPTGVPGVETFGAKEGSVVVGTRGDHALLRFVALDELAVHSHTAMVVTERGEIIIEGSEGPLAAVSAGASLQLVIVPFDPLDSNWPFQRGFLNFVSNAVQWLASFSRPLAIDPREVGQSERVEAGQQGVSFVATHGSQATRHATSGPDGLAIVGPLDRMGVWLLSSNGTEIRTIAVRGPGPEESRIDAASTLALPSMGTAVESASASGGGRRALWPWLLLAALAMLAIEWWWYLRQV